uniref:WAP domain-containing protein n=1 Tax=Strigamia maritima TaxID=126957 RepID=T1ILL5_STRMM
MDICALFFLCFIITGSHLRAIDNNLDKHDEYVDGLLSDLFCPDIHEIQFGSIDCSENPDCGPGMVCCSDVSGIPQCKWGLL